MNWFSVSLIWVVCTVPALGQLTRVLSPCAYQGSVLHGPGGQVVRFDTEQMKERATHKEDLPWIVRQMDAKSVVIVDVLIKPDGSVGCAKGLAGIPILRGATEKALMRWRFKPEKQDGKNVAYLGHMEFTLCNIDCDDGEMGMTLFK